MSDTNHTWWDISELATVFVAIGGAALLIQQSYAGNEPVNFGMFALIVLPLLFIAVAKSVFTGETMIGGLRKKASRANDPSLYWGITFFLTALLIIDVAYLLWRFIASR